MVKTIGAEQIAEALGISERHVRRMDTEGKLPLGLRIGRLRRWEENEFDHWVKAGCPARRRWETIKEGGR